MGLCAHRGEMRGLDGEGGGNEDGWDRVDTMLGALGFGGTVELGMGD